MVAKEKMNPKKTARSLEDVKINVKMKLSALWVAVMLCYIYGDIFTLNVPGIVEKIIAGKMMGLVSVTPMLLIGSSILMTIPSIMVFLSLALKPKINRWANIILGLLYTFVMLFTMLIDSFDPWRAFYMFLGIIEVAVTLLIVSYAWKWPKQEA